jgi:hypothetical protein
MADVLPTNNGMLKRSVLAATGLFDLAYDRGQRADGDLGARIYKRGVSLILNPEIRLLHHHAPVGGLRKHKARKVTFATSRKFINHFRLPHRTELYLNKRHFSKKQQREAIYLILIGTFSIRGNRLRKLMKIIFAGFLLPYHFFLIWSRDKEATEMLLTYPQIPALKNNQ